MKTPQNAANKVLALGMGMILAAWTSFATADNIQLGAPIPVTGPYASDGQVMEQAIRLAVNQINARGGLNGKQVDITVFDIGDLTPDKLVAAASSLLDRDDVDVLVNGYGGMGPDIPAFCPYDQPYIHADATSNVVTMRNNMGCDNTFMATDIDRNYGKLSFDAIMATGHNFANRNIAFVRGPIDWEINTPDGAAEAAEAAGWSVVMTEDVPWGTTEWSGIISRLRSAEPSLIYVELLDPAAIVALVEQLKASPVPGAVLYAGYSVSIPAVGEIIASGALDGVLGLTLSAHRPGARGDAFNALWKSEYGADAPLGIAAQVYDQVNIWAQAVEKAGDARDFQAVQEAMRTSIYDGLVGAMQFNGEQYITAGEDIPVQLLQIQDAKLVRIVMGTRSIADFQLPVWAQ